MTLKERISILSNALGLSIREFERSCGLKRGNISNMTGALGSDKLTKIIDAYPELNLHWLLTGEGEIFETKTPKNVRDENPNENPNKNPNIPKLQKTLGNDEGNFKTKTPKNATLENGGEKGGKKGGIPKLQKTPPFESDKLEIATESEMPLVTLANASDLVSIPVTDVEAAAGAGALNPDYFDTSERMQLPASMLPGGGGERICIMVAGESMAPTLPDGSRVVIRRLPHAEYPQIPNNHICVVTDRDGETYIKRIKNRLKAAGVLTLVSDNPNKRKYKPFDIAETEIHNIWVAELFITDSVVNCADFVATDNEVAKMREDLTELRREVAKIAEKVEKAGK